MSSVFRLKTKPKLIKGGVVAQLVERRTNMNTPLTQVRFYGAASDFSPRVNSQCRLSYGDRIALVCDRTLKIPSLGSHTFVWTHETTARTVGNG